MRAQAVAVLGDPLVGVLAPALEVHRDLGAVRGDARDLGLVPAQVLDAESVQLHAHREVLHLGALHLE